MQKPVINTSDEFIFAKLHGMWANAAKDARLAQLANAGSVDEIIRLLAEYKLDASRRELFHRNLLQREIESLSAISAQLDKRTAEYARISTTSKRCSMTNSLAARRTTAR